MYDGELLLHMTRALLINRKIIPYCLLLHKYCRTQQWGQGTTMVCELLKHAPALSFSPLYAIVKEKNKKPLHPLFCFLFLSCRWITWHFDVSELTWKQPESLIWMCDEVFQGKICKLLQIIHLHIEFLSLALIYSTCSQFWKHWAQYIYLTTIHRSSW